MHVIVHLFNVVDFGITFACQRPVHYLTTRATTVDALTGL